MKYKRVLVFFLIIFFLAIIARYEVDVKDKNYEKEECFVERVVDGDTLVCKIDGIRQNVRLLGIDTPEKGENLYLEAKKFLQITENQTIMILRDWDDKGKYYRKLRYIFYNGRNLNIELVELGLAEVFMEDDLAYEDKLLRAERYAKENELGIWNPGYVR